MQDDLKASFEQSTGVIRQLNESNAKLQAERDLLRAKIVGSAEQQEETTALMKRTGVIVEKLMDKMPCRASSAEGWWRNPWMLTSSILRIRKSSSPLAVETSSCGCSNASRK